MTLNPSTILAELKAFLHEAGTLGLSIQQTAKQSEKEDSTIVTEADLAISKLFQQRFAPYLSLPGHVLIDEEVEKGELDETLAADYQWIIDPIDGTATYAGGGFFWGIIVSVYRKGQPWVGAVYVPALNMLYWADETTAYETRNAFTDNETTAPLAAKPQRFSASTQVQTHFYYVASMFKTNPCIVVDYWSPLHGAMVAAGRLGGSIFRDAVWDFSASLLLATRVGYKMRRMADGQVFSALDGELLKPDWSLANLMFIGPDEVYEGLTRHIRHENAVATA